MRAGSTGFAYTKHAMTVRGGATKYAGWLACLLVGCVPHQDAQPEGSATRAFGRSEQDLFAAEQPAEQAAVVADPKPERAEPTPSVAAAPAVTALPSAIAAAENLSAPETASSDADAAMTPLSMSSDPLLGAASLPKRTERELRNAFATADAAEVSQAGLDLAAFLAERERQFDALHVIDLALKRQRSVPLRLARASLLRDVARCDLAIEELQAVVREVGAADVSPATLLDLVQVQWVVGDHESAAATLRTLRSEHADDAWLSEHADDLALWQSRVQDTTLVRDSLANGELRDLFALLRAAPIVVARLKMLDTLAAPPISIEPSHDDRHEVRVRAIAIACADESAAVRARAVHLAAVNGLHDEPFWATALADPAPLVRRFAAVGAARQLGRGAAPMLYAALAVEADDAVLRSLHKSLAKVFQIPEPEHDLTTAPGRETAISYWKLRCEQ